MSMRPVALQVRDGELVDSGSWVYVWLRPGSERRVIFVGATALPPAARMWLHLHHEDPDIGWIAARYPVAGGDANETFDILAFPVPEGVARRAMRDALIARLAAAGELSALYCGFPPVEQGDPDGASAAAEAVHAELHRRA
jgi:hypothetical protein